MVPPPSSTLNLLFPVDPRLPIGGSSGAREWLPSSSFPPVSSSAVFPDISNDSTSAAASSEVLVVCETDRLCFVYQGLNNLLLEESTAAQSP